MITNPEKIKKFLNNCKKIAIIGVGNPLSKPDSVGLILAEIIAKKKPGIEVVLAYNTPENVLSKYLESNHTHIIVIDAVKAGANPLQIIPLNINEISMETPTTHTIPISFLLKMLEKSGKKTLVLGIEIPENDYFEVGIIERASEEIISLIEDSGCL